MENWTKTKIGDMCQTFSGGTPSRTVSKYYGGNIPWIKSGELNSRLIFETGESITEEAVKNSSAKFVNPNTILVAMYGATAGVIAISKIKATINQAILAVVPNNGSFENLYLFYQLEHSMSDVLKNLQGAQPNLNAEIIKNTIIPVPPLGEQKKIAEILSTWDKSIETTEKIIAAKQKLKKSLMQRLLTGSQRFPEFHGQQWKQIHIGDIAREVSAKNKKDNQLTVLSCTKHKGLVDSLSYFGKQIFSKNLSTYKIVKRGQFAYATNHIEEGSIGYQNLHDEALISPMYTVFQTNAEIDDSFLYKLLKTETYRHIFEAMTSGSINRRGSLRWNHFTQIKLKLPPIEEQKKIAAVLNNCDAEINVLQNKSGALRQQKCGLMQKLLTGRVRVKTEESENAAFEN